MPLEGSAPYLRAPADKPDEFYRGMKEGRHFMCAFYENVTGIAAPEKPEPPERPRPKPKHEDVRGKANPRGKPAGLDMSEEILAFLAEHDMTATEFAGLLGVSANSVCKWKAGLGMGKGSLEKFNNLRRAYDRDHESAVN